MTSGGLDAALSPGISCVVGFGANLAAVLDFMVECVLSSLVKTVNGLPAGSPAHCCHGGLRVYLYTG